MNEPTVYIVDDDPDMRDSLQWLMKTIGLQVSVFGSAHEFLREYDPSQPGCLVFDVRMPGIGGLDLFERLVAKGEDLPVIFITAYADVPMAVRAIRSGAVEFVEKPFNRQALLDKVQQAIDRDLQRRRELADRESILERFRSLTDKEWEVIALIKEGEPNKSMAARLDITPRAVEMRRASLMRKLGVRSLAELLRLTYSHETQAVGRNGTRG